MENRFDVDFLQEAMDFLESIDEKARNKIIYNLHKARRFNDVELLKKLNDNIWEFRTLYGKKHYRLFAFWAKDQNRLIIATHGIIKKTKRTHRKEIEKAEELMKKYYEQK